MVKPIVASELKLAVTTLIFMDLVSAVRAERPVKVSSRNGASLPRVQGGRVAVRQLACLYSRHVDRRGEPLAAFSALNIHTSPPNAPTMKDTAPNSSDTFTPSLASSPA